MTDCIRESIDRSLSGLTFTQEDRMRILTAIKEDKPLLRKKMNVSFALAMLLVLLAAVALAVGLSYSAKHMATQTARQALMTKYGLTQEMLKMFDGMESCEQNGKTSIAFYSLDGSQFVNAEAMGQYTVIIDGGNAIATWSHDNVDPTTWQNGDLESPVWGAPQLQALLDRYALYQQWKTENEGIHELPMAEQEQRYDELYKLVAPLKLIEGPISTEESTAEESVQQSAMPTAVPEAMQTFAPTPMPGELSAEQLTLFARQALEEEYGLTEQELDGYMITVWYQYDENDNCCVDFNSPETNGYVVLRATDGEIQEIWMDSALGSNG